LNTDWGGIEEVERGSRLLNTDWGGVEEGEVAHGLARIDG